VTKISYCGQKITETFAVGNFGQNDLEK